MSHGQAGPYEIELASGRLLDEAMDFCCTAYRRKGYIGEHTDSHPDRFYAIRKDGVLCGTIGLYMPSPNRPCFPTEAVFGYSLAQAGVDPHSAGEVGRFTGEGQLFAPIISWLALHMHADLRLRHAIFGAKPRLYRALDRMGIPVDVHPAGEPDLTAVPRAFRPYFETPPEPIVMTVSVPEAVGVARQTLKRIEHLGHRSVEPFPTLIR
jgi:hypothetical protein